VLQWARDSAFRFFPLLAFSGPAPDPTDLSRRWHRMLAEVERLIELLPAEQAGTCVIAESGELFRGTPASLEEALRRNAVRFHRGTIHGAWPRIA